MNHRQARRLWTRRIAGVLFCLVFGSAFGFRGAQGAHRARLSSDLVVHEGRHTAQRKRVILHGTPEEVQAIAERHRLSIVRLLGGGGAVVSVNSAELTELASDDLVEHISPDARVHLMMTVSNTSTGATQVRTGTKGLLGLVGAYPAVTGKGIGVAVLDSGISTHAALKNVVASVNFVTGETGTSDEFGHGTHVAGIIGGAATNVTSLYAGGIAPDANIINVRVLGPDGTGTTSDVIAGMEWAIANRTRYNIRVINLSLGHPVTEPSVTDPLCEEVEKATALGIVVVAAAGNAGKTADGRTVLGGIASPGNSPFALTVGAVNTWQTPGRSDDSVTTYSSRGPTRFEQAVKPDVVAPGNKIVSLEASQSYLSHEFLRAPRRRKRDERVHAPERHEHGDADGQRRGRAAAAGEPVAHAGTGEAGAAVRRDVPARGWLDGRRCRQRELLDVTADRRNRRPRARAGPAGRPRRPDRRVVLGYRNADHAPLPRAGPPPPEPGRLAGRVAEPLAACTWAT